MTPDESTNQELTLAVGDGHQLYVHDWGKEDASLPIFFLHGGPGSHTKDGHKQYFSPEKQRVIFHDQRGTGKSVPLGSLEKNTTEELVEDIVKIADKLNIEKFIIAGGSWGSCLALIFALKHPEKVSAMVLHGIFTGSQTEIDWLDKGRFQNFFPDVWEKYLASVPQAHRDDPSAYHYEHIMSSDEQAAKESGLAYETLEGSAMNLDDRYMPTNSLDYDPSAMRIEMHYMHNGCFMPDRYILENAHSLKMPVYVVQGRYDMVCPPVTAYELSKQLPNCNLIMTVSGHRGEHETWNSMRFALLELTKEKRD